MKQEVLHGDCLELMKKIPSESIDLVATDPPYKMTKRGKSCRPNWMPNNMGENVFSGNIPDSLDWMKEAFRVLREKTHFYTFCNTNDLQEYLVNAEKAGFGFHNLITVIKDTGMPNRWYLKRTELLLFFRKGKAKPINDMTSRNYVEVIMPKQSSGKLHITQKPLPLMEQIVYNSSDENQIVLDPFAGSGTTLLAAKNLNRQFIGIEKEKKYYDICIERLGL